MKRLIFSTAKLLEVPAPKYLSASEIADLNIKTEVFRKSKGKGGSKTNKKASAGRAFCHFGGKKIVTEHMKGRDPGTNKDMAEKALIEKLNTKINQPRSITLQKNAKVANAELQALVKIPFEHDDELYTEIIPN